jgi:hypothetical protein
LGQVGKKLLHQLAPAPQQPVGVLTLRNPLAVMAQLWEVVAFQNGDLFKMLRQRPCCQQTTHACADHNRVFTRCVHGLPRGFRDGFWEEGFNFVERLEWAGAAWTDWLMRG